MLVEIRSNASGASGGVTRSSGKNSSVRLLAGKPYLIVQREWDMDRRPMRVASFHKVTSESDAAMGRLQDDNIVHQ